ncbi:MAG: MFS transporter [Actinobacteria bacterium]|nr:MFS transporter [Actinomycetota bacterium]MCG2819225.1 MFS transporter [Actinomycetes bacterium]MBU4179374.1 MFS transporter [Actinomycetota bacterium]MBU4218316.1 MFS transporter [Actinomycetota bacterium]MBU4357876.1 MFS transporter [Actinomycetota bacterium]
MEQEESFGLYRYRWIVLGAFMLVGALVQVMWLNYAAITSTSGTGADRMVGVAQLMQVSEFKITLLATMFPLVFILVSIPAGIIIDRKGFRFAVMLGVVLTAGFSFLRLFTANYTLVLIGMIGIAIGQPFVNNSITKMVAAWFPTEESALATGLATLSLFIGMIIALALTPALLKMFGDTLGGVRGIVLVYGIAAVVVVVAFALLGRASPPKPPKRTEEELQEEGASVNLGSIRKIFGLYDFRLLCIIIFIGQGAFIAILQLIDQILKPKGISSETAGFIGAVMVIAGVVGSVVIPSLSDKYKKRKPFLLLAALVALPTLFLIAQLNSTMQIYMVSVVTGFFILSAFPLMLTLSEETTGHRLTGTGTAILLLLGNAGGVALTLVMESIMNATGGENNSYYWAMMFVVFLFAVAFVVALFIREKNTRFPVEP